MTDARAFRGFRFPADVILWAVRWYLQFPVSYRDLERMLGWVQDTCKKWSQGGRLPGTDPFRDLAHDAPAGPAADLLVDLADAKIGGRGDGYLRLPKVASR